MLESHPDNPDIIVNPLFGEKIGTTIILFKFIKF